MSNIDNGKINFFSVTTADNVTLFFNKIKDFFFLRKITILKKKKINQNR